jgi:hypothetical protein
MPLLICKAVFRGSGLRMIVADELRIALGAERAKTIDLLAPPARRGMPVEPAHALRTQLGPRVRSEKGHVWTSGNRGRVISDRLHRGSGHIDDRFAGRELIMTNYVGLDVSQKTTTLCIVDGEGHRQWRGECVTDCAGGAATN